MRSVNCQIKEMRSDAFSELPDSLLIHILSFLDVKSAGITSVLSKRWKYLWAESPNLVFLGNKHALNFVSWVNRTIAIRQGTYLEKSVVDFGYNECFASDVDSWVEFSVKNKVKELVLGLSRSRNTYYTPPRAMYLCSSLTTLNLRGCIMAHGGTIMWQSLTDLRLYEVVLNQHLLDEILSSCPVLNNLELRACLGFNRLEVNSRCLNRLALEESKPENENEQFVEISAPYIRILDIVVFPQGRKWHIRNIRSVVTASIEFFDLDIEVSVEWDYVYEFLENFKHVNDLHVKYGCLEVISEMPNGWQLPIFGLQHLRISCSEYDGISGILSLLESSPNLETLLLNGSGTEGQILKFHRAKMADLNGDLLHLRKIRVNKFVDPNGEPLLMLAQILLRRAPALEEMVIVVDIEDTTDCFNISQALLTYSRSSTKAKIHLSRGPAR